ncbi:leucine-rich repeat-containing G-protein coupled receptor 5 [Galendromus occidentalis]|uniref:Leucine-rich repeat-containing G-protein coupled receptor 5 n=1 Tax=Galendromus occidentalis TaxID=34638 RepID=A0AAJ7WJ36_9ACAR|nr:leucine-rich repeat-containing G-protein coupled receptor 5 [Galendromus occidentalis]
MRLTCEVHIGFRKSGRPVRRLGAATITIRSNLRDSRVYNLVISTNKQIECGLYKNLKINIVKLFTSCVKEGKMTISFNEPPHDVLIRKATVPQLEKFLSILRAIGKGEEISTRFLKEAKMEAPPPRVMKISERSQYPVRGFPSSLERLHINCIKLSRIQKSILDLSNLVELCLDDNSLKAIPAEISNTRLVSLSLANNDLTEVNDIFLGPLGRTIKDLNLSNNRIRRLTYSIARPKFRSLDLSHNDLHELPTFFQGGPELKLLRLEGTNVRHLPSSFMAKTAKVVMAGTHSSELIVKFDRSANCPKLLDLCCIRIHQTSAVVDLPFELVMPRAVHAYLLSFVRCRVCGRFTFPSANRRSIAIVAYLDLMNSFESLAGDGSSVGTRLDYLCSEGCFDYYKRRHDHT